MLERLFDLGNISKEKNALDSKGREYNSFILGMSNVKNIFSRKPFTSKDEQCIAKALKDY